MGLAVVKLGVKEPALQFKPIKGEPALVPEKLGGIAGILQRSALRAQRKMLEKQKEVEVEIGRLLHKVAASVITELTKKENKEGIIPAIHIGFFSKRPNGFIDKQIAVYRKEFTKVLKDALRYSIQQGLVSNVPGLRKVLDTAGSNINPKLSRVQKTKARKRASKAVLEATSAPADVVNLPSFEFSGPLADRVWENSEEARKGINNIVLQGIEAGRSPSAIARDLEQFVGGVLEGTGVPRNPRASAERLARTETNHAFFKSQQEYYDSKRWIIGKKWHLSSGHSIPCICEANQGKIFPKETTLAPLHPNCMCYLTPVLDKSLTKGISGTETKPIPKTLKKKSKPKSKVSKIPKKLKSVTGGKGQ